MFFKGLPSPGGGMAVVSMVLLHEKLGTITSGWKASPWLANTVLYAMPAVTLAAALLMVSRFRYRHLINQFLRGRKPFGYVVKLLIIVMAIFVIGLEITLAIVAVGFMLTGPANWAWHRLRPAKPAAA